MLDKKDNIQTLMRLGLSNSQAKVYLTMAKVGVVKAMGLWKITEVGRQDIYRILNELKKLGLVEEVLTSPREYKAIPLGRGVSTLMQRKKEDMINLQTEARKLSATRHLDEEKMLLDKFCCVMIPEKEASLLRVKQGFERTKRSIDVTSTPKRALLALSKLPYAKAVNRGVEVRMIIRDRDKDWVKNFNTPLVNKPNFKLRWVNAEPTSAYSIFDRKEIFIATSTDNGITDGPLLWSNYPAIAQLFSDYFDMRWNIAEEIQSEN